MTGAPQASGCSDIQVSGPGSLTWTSTAPAGSSGEVLLAGAKELMKGIYTLTPAAPDYLPTSYAGQKQDQTGYLIHSKVITSVVWPAAGKTQVEWGSVPGDKPKGWSGTTVVAGPVNMLGKPKPVSVETDCSGFITSLFAYANTQAATQFTSWKPESTIPEAGCFNPQGGCNEPAPLSYYNLFTTGQGGFRSVSLEDLQPGDLIAYANTKDKSDSGHIMLVAAVSSCTGDPDSRYMVVIDETGSPHSNDTRPVTVLPSGEKTGAGLGMGIIKLTNSPQNTLQFYWSLKSAAPEIGSIALGRAL